MKTPMQELIERLNNVKPQDFCSIETIKGWAKELLEKEKQTMVDFAYKCRNLMAGDEFAIAHWYDKTFESVNSSDTAPSEAPTESAKNAQTINPSLSR